MRLVSTMRSAIPVSQARPAPAEPASELELQCWELWSLSSFDVAWFAAVTFAAGIWVLIMR